MYRSLRASRRTLLAGALLLAAQVLPARAQGDDLSEAALRGPWEQHLLVLQSLAGPIASTRDASQRAALADSLATLQVTLGEYETQVDQVIDRLIGDPQYSYAAAETSQALGRQLAEVHRQFDALYRALDATDRADVRGAQASLDALRLSLESGTAFERDVTSALGSGSRQLIVGLATRWWKGEEQALAVKNLVAALRQELEGLPEGGAKQ
jgi:hypothetical protein